MQDFEKLGAFYLGRSYDLASQSPRDELLLYDAKDLTTHAVCVGMTGSGKTGLCLALLEEAAIDGIPAIAIDPKGDLANLLLAFPQLQPADFAPWVNEEEARASGLSTAEFAARQAAAWKEGLAKWGQGPERIQRLLDAADFAVYTPGSNAGQAVSILRSFAAPPPAILEDSELLQERVRSTASGLLALLGIDADPIQSREHILLANILDAVWRQGGDLDLVGLIQAIQAPPVTRLGVLDLDSFFPAKDRYALAMRLNNLLASPGFAAWLAGEPLDIGAALYSPSGKPRISIYSIAHLGDAERMFFVSLLLNQTLGWMRAQPGTTSLRAILYMDEIFGYFPPVANPPSKQPLLTLLKQARAFGLGVVLATQNPVDLDYKGLANAGTWFVGRLQTERDKARLLDGLEGAAAHAGAGFDRRRLEEVLSSLGKRVFLMNNVHDSAPEVFQTRWTLSYLRGPMTRAQIRSLSADRGPESASAAQPAPAAGPPRSSPAVPAGAPASPAAAPAPASPAPPARAAGGGAARPVLPPEIPQYFFPVRGTAPPGARLVYEPAVYGAARVYFRDAKSGADVQTSPAYLARISAGAVAIDWERAEAIDLPESELESEPAPGASWAPLPAAAGKVKSYDEWKRTFQECLYRTQELAIRRSPGLKLLSNPGEAERDFRIRLQQAGREERDRQVERLRQKFAPKLAALEERIRRAQQAVQRESEQARESKLQTAISFGATLLGAFLGRKTLSASTIGRATTTARGMSRSLKDSQDVGRAEENVGALRQQLADLEAQFQAETGALEARVDAASEELETLELRPKKADIAVRVLGLAWAPSWQGPGDAAAPAWR